MMYYAHYRITSAPNQQDRSDKDYKISRLYILCLLPFRNYVANNGQTTIKLWYSVTYYVTDSYSLL